jgi:hypothetical protein
MIYYVSYLKDRLGNNYLGLNIPPDVVDPYLNELKSILGEEDFEIYVKNQQTRDGGKNHLTVINVGEYNRLISDLGMDKFVNSLELIFNYEIDDLEMRGVGTATKSGSTTYFIVCKSDKLEAIRSRYDIPKFDFHVTLAFNPKDVFGVPKNKVID